MIEQALADLTAAINQNNALLQKVLISTKSEEPAKKSTKKAKSEPVTPEDAGWGEKVEEKPEPIEVPKDMKEVKTFSESEVRTALTQYRAKFGTKETVRLIGGFNAAVMSELKADDYPEVMALIQEQLQGDAA